MELRDDERGTALWSRRALLTGGGAGVVAALAGAGRAARAEPTNAVPPWMRAPGGPDEEYGRPSTYEAHVRRARRPAPPERAVMSSWRTPLEHQRGIITPSGLHFSVHHNGVPAIDPSAHRLMVHGMVERPLRWDLEQLLRYPMVSRIHFLECAGNTGANAVMPMPLQVGCQELFGEVSCSEWTGVPLRVLLEEAGLKPGASWVVAEGADGGSHARSLPLKKLLDDAMVALFQNGERLRPSQGYPVRLLVPGWEGNVNVKWLHRLEVSDRPAFTKDESGMYTQILEDGRLERFAFTMEVKSVITRPSGGQLTAPPGRPTEIAGLAWSGRGKIARVDVSVDGGTTWHPATLGGPVLDRAFTTFSLPWTWDGKPALLLSRAEDEHGVVQPSRSRWKARYAAHSYNHYNAIQAWAVGADGTVENRYA